jgi:regulator of sigma E protease
MSALTFLLILLILVLVHELGHFIVARMFGVRVDEFGIGFPPRAFTFGKWLGTEYTLNWLPFGGFVRIFGEQKDETAAQDRHHAFAYKKWWQQMAILFAGVFANLIVAWFLISYAIGHGAPVTVDENGPLASAARVTISKVLPESPAEIADIEVGDKVIALQSETDTLQDLTPTTVASFVRDHNGERLTFTLDRKGEQVTRTVTPAQGVFDTGSERPAIGVSMGFLLVDNVPLYKTLLPGLMQTGAAFFDILKTIGTLIAGLFTGSADLSSISGPVGIAVYAGQWSQLGFVYLLYFTAMISINLAVINLLPVPALDGGRMVFVLIERIFKRPVPGVVASIMNSLGLVFIVGLMVVVTWSDVAKLF